MPEQRFNKIIDKLRCPNCHHPLTSKPKELQCSNCKAMYPIIDNVPLLMTENSRKESNIRLETEEGQSMVAEYAISETEKDHAKVSIIQTIISILRPPQVMLDYREHTKNHPLSKLWNVNGKSQIALNVGGGPHRESNSVDEMTMNLQSFHNVDLVGDAHNIPAEDNSFDSILSMAVLEHVSNPQKVVEEMVRVLKPGGQLYSEVPFIFFYHGYPADYSRFTREGMRQLFSMLDDVEIGMTHGPVSATLQTINTLIQVLISPRFPLLRKIVNGIYRWLFFLFKYIDLLLQHNPTAHLIAGGFYVYGKKPIS